MEILIIVGTAREGRNTIKVANAVKEAFLDQGHDLVFYDLKHKDIPPLGNRTYKEGEEPVPEDIEKLSDEVRNADSIVIASPEYNHGIPGVLKNALDYLYPEYDEKIFSYVTVSAGGFGGIRALDKLHSFTVAVSGEIGPSLNVSKVNNKFSGNKLVDEGLEKSIYDFIEEIESSLM